MTPLEKQYFDKLSEYRTKDANSLESPSLRGIIKSISKKYSDPTHFVYELLQNADDAGATSARFVLHKDKLIFAHNGERRFSVSDPATEGEDGDSGTLGDINAITSIYHSNKKGKSIGGFGVGFKAVLRYTETQYIYAPNVFFKIDQIIVPSLIEHDFPGRHQGETLFVLPFIKEQSAVAYDEISEKLRSLNLALLFLANLKEIIFEIPDTSGAFGSYYKSINQKQLIEETTAEFICLTQKNGDALSDDKLWLFTRNVPGGHCYSIGFSIKEGRLSDWSPLPAYCFFSTKEATGLKFIVNAPFLLTDNREGIEAGAQHNKDMIDLLANLAADSLVYLRDIGTNEGNQLINDDIFDVIPYNERAFENENNRDKISFRPFYTKIKEKMSSETLLPTTDGFASKKNAYWAYVSSLPELFSNKQLALLCDNQDAKWVFTSFGRENTRSKNNDLTQYIDSIINTSVNEDDILNGRKHNDRAKAIGGIDPSFIETQPISWLHLFYKWISERSKRTEIIRTKPIFLNQDRKATAAFDTNKQEILFLPTETTGYNTVLPELLENTDTAEFLKQLGVKPPTLFDEIYNHILPQYDVLPVPADIDTVLHHFDKLFEYYKKCPQAKINEFIKHISKYALFLRHSDDADAISLCKGDDLYFPTDNLLKWFQSKPDTKFVEYEEYLQRVGLDNKEYLDKFLNEIGIRDMPRILLRNVVKIEAEEPPGGWNHSTYGEKWVDRYIDGCAEFVEKTIHGRDEGSSLLLWSQLLGLAEKGYLSSAFKGTYKYYYYTNREQKFESNEAKRLRTAPWLLNIEGSFVSANNVTRQTLSPKYKKNEIFETELFQLLGVGNDIDDYSDISHDDEFKALVEEYRANKRHQNESIPQDKDNGTKNTQIDTPQRTAISNLGEEIIRKAISIESAERTSSIDKDPSADEDEYSKPAVNFNEKIKQIEEKSAKDINQLVLFKDLQKQALESERYTYGWFKALLKLEAANSGEDRTDSREISISFSKVEHEMGTSRTLVLKHPNRYIPQSMEELADIPLELHFANRPAVRVAIEVINVKEYTLRAKLRTNSEVDNIDLSLVTEAKIEAKSPVFLADELRKAFESLGYDDNFNMQKNLCENIEFIFGPPGTGKTKHLAQKVILPLMQNTEDAKILVLTPTNKAADVLVRSVMETMGADLNYLNWLVRFGNTEDNDIEQSGILRDKTFDIRTLPRNVTVTTIARFPYDYFFPDKDTRLHLNALKWDYIIIDEASMIPLANIVYPLYKKTPIKFIIAGDPFQIEPITSVDIWKDENIYTMVGLESFTDPKTVPHAYHVELLTTQHRSIPEIGEVFSQFAYGGILKHDRTAESRSSLPIGDLFDIGPLNIIKFPVSKYESIYRPKRLQKSNYQIYSALFAFELLNYLSSQIGLTEKKALFRIGLIAPYRAQADLIDKLMTSVSLPKNIDVQVGTIHGFQGDECDVILALFNPPPTIRPPHESKEMFLNKLNIINVSISRARDCLFIIMPDDETENIGNLKLIKKVEQLCINQPKCVEYESHALEELIFGNLHYIEDNSFSTSHQLVNVYCKPEKKYEVRSEDNAIDIQIHS